MINKKFKKIWIILVLILILNILMVNPIYAEDLFSANGIEEEDNAMELMFDGVISIDGLVGILALLPKIFIQVIAGIVQIITAGIASIRRRKF